MSWEKRFKAFLVVCLVLMLAPGLMGVSTGTYFDHLGDVRHRGELVVGIRQGQSSYFQGPFGPAGFQYELVQQYADELGVRLRLVEVESLAEALSRLGEGELDLAVGFPLDLDSTGDGPYAYSIPVTAASQAVACKGRKETLPTGAGQLAGKVLAVAGGSHHPARLQSLKGRLPGLAWTEIPGASEENLLGMVHAGKSACAVVDTHDWELHRHLFPDVRLAFELPGKTLFGWIFQDTRGESLRESANAWLAMRQADGTVARLRDRYYAHMQSLTEADTHGFHKAIRLRLPQYSAAFRREAERNGIDWRLLAAVAYQESHWDPAAQSPTGVQGLMQLTLSTALELGIDDRTDPLASIRGGARYLRQMIDQLPADIPEQDRVWMALAAYNAGLAHVMDARELTSKRGGNPNAWSDVRDTLPLLKQQQWYSQTRYGYARGATQAIIYVRHVRRYYDLLVLASNSTERGDLMIAMGSTPATGRL